MNYTKADKEFRKLTAAMKEDPAKLKEVLISLMHEIAILHHYYPDARHKPLLATLTERSVAAMKEAS